MKKQNGITLIALIITIIVMLILVGVSVTIALEGGLFGTAKDVADRYEAEKANETKIATEEYIQGIIDSIGGTGNPEGSGLEPGLYAADGTMTYTWEELLMERELSDGYEGQIIYVENGVFNTSYVGIEGVNYSEDYLVGTLVLDDSVTTLGEWSLSSLHNLTKIIIPDSVTKIYELNDMAMTWNEGITAIAIPDSVTDIDTNAFRQFESLETIYYSGSAEGAPWDENRSTAEITILPYSEAPADLIP